MKIIVLGAGVIGTTSAYFLAKAGHEVIVLEKNKGSALACSKANGGQLSYCHVETWASKASFLSILKASFLPNSFLTFAKFPSFELFKWLFEFYKNSSPQKSANNSDKLFNLSIFSKEVLHEIIKEEKIKFNYQDSGTLHFYRSKKKLDLAIAQLEDFKGSYKILSPEECVEKEPTLVRMLDEKELAGGIFYDLDASGNAFLFTRALEEICKKKYNVKFDYGVKIKNIFTNYEKITGINTSDGVFVADNYISCLGAYSNKLLKGIKIDTKIYPLKGYSLSIEADDEFIAPKMALSDVENKIVYSRLGNIFRAAGTVEIAGLKSEKNHKNINFLSKIIHQSFSDFGNFNETIEWSGFRPFRPNSLPLICRVKKYGNLFLNTGHGSLGWTLSAASGKILANLVDGKKYNKFSFLEDENL